MGRRGNHSCLLVAVILAILPLVLVASDSTVYTYGSNQVDVSQSVSVTKSGLVLNRATNTFDATLTLANNSGVTLRAPLSIVFSSISSSSVTLANATGKTPEGLFYLDLPGAGDIPPGGSIRNTVVKFNNPNRITFTYQVKILAAWNRPVANAGTDQTVHVGDLVSLDGSRSSDLDGLPLSYEWSFAALPDGSSATLSDPASVSPTFYADTQGVYEVRLIVRDMFGSGSPATVRISTANSQPVANAGPDQTVPLGATVQLDGSNSSDVDGDSLTHSWTILSKPAGSDAELSQPNAVKPVFCADEPGTYSIQLIVNDGWTDSNPSIVTITTGNSRPTANAGDDRTGFVGSVVTLAGSGSHDPDGDTLTYRWSLISFPEGSVSQLSGPDTVNPFFTIDLPGIYVVQLIVSDGNQESPPDTVAITTQNSHPIAHAGSGGDVYVGETVTLDGSGSHDPDGDPLAYSWSLITRPDGSLAFIVDPDRVDPSFVPDLAGDYVGQLIVNDGFLSSDPGAVSFNARFRMTTVPAVAGSSQVSAEAAIIAANLKVGAISTENSTTVEAGYVIGQSPAAGSSVPVDSPVSLVISLGPPMATVPDVVGQSRADALAAIASVGLATGAVSTQYSATVPAGFVISQNPPAGTSVIQGSSVDMVVSLGPVMTTVPGVVGLPLGEAQATITGASLQVGTLSYENNGSVASGNVISQSPSAGSTVAVNSLVDLVISLGPDSGPLPPDPWTVAPPNKLGVATTLGSSVSFLYTGANPIQTGVTDTIDVTRTAVLRGKVIDNSGNPIPGVTVTIAGCPGLGQTLTRSDGMYDMVANGGGPLTLNFSKSDLIPAQRTVQAPWQDWRVLEDVILIERDLAETAIDGSLNTYQAHRASLVTDNDGSRRATILFPPGITATPAGGASLSRFTVRATEFTVGQSGPKAMPAMLPPSSSYTYAAELSVDGVDQGVQVTFSEPVQYYLENFIGFPVGTHVPTGYYDSSKAAWVAVPDGRVIRIVSIENGMARVDTDGDGEVDNMPVDFDDEGIPLTFGIGEGERALLATLYPAGAELWRVELTHFSSVDMNYASGPSSNATAPNPGNITIDSNLPPGDGGIQGFGKLSPESRTLTETIELTGIPFTLNYDSRRVPAGPRGIAIPVTGATVPPDLLKAHLQIEVAGRVFEEVFNSPPANFTYKFLWDGTDAYGRLTTGAQPMRVRIGYEYPNYYYTPWGQIAMNELVSSFARMGLSPYNISARTTTVLWSESTTYTGKPNTAGVLDSRGIGLGGWTLSAHHVYDPIRHTLCLGSGGSIEQPTLLGSVRYIAGTGEQGYSGDGGPAKQARLSAVQGLAVGPDGSLYISGYHEVRKVDPKTGIITTVAGTGSPEGELGDGGSAISAMLYYPEGLSIGPDGSLYIADNGNGRIRRVDPQGVITTVAGDHEGSFSSGIPATLAGIGYPMDVAVAPDGSFFIGGDSTYMGIQHVGTDGILTRTDARAEGLERLNGRIALGPDGSLYVAFRYGEDRIYRIAPNGTVTAVAGTLAGGWDSTGDGGPAIEANLANPRDIAVGPDGVIYILDNLYNSYEIVNVIRRIGTDGIISTIAPRGSRRIVDSDGGPLNGVDMNHAVIATGPDGTLYVGTNGGDTKAVGKLEPVMPGFDGTEIVIPSSQGDLLYVFDPEGRHMKTLHGLTNQVLLTFGYDTMGRLDRATDADGNVTVVERDASGTPTGITGPYGQRTELKLNGDGWLSEVTSPAVAKWGLGYNGAGGLLTQVVTPTNATYSFEYDAEGFLTKAVDAGNAATLLSSTGGSNWTEVMVTSPGGIATRYRTEFLPTGEQVRTKFLADGLYERMREYSESMREVTRPDGTVTVAELAPDPRFGMQAAYVKKAVTTYPGGLTSNATLDRQVTLADPDNVFSLLTMVETTMFNGNINEQGQIVDGVTRTEAFDRSTLTFTSTSPSGRQSTRRMDSKGQVVNTRSGNLEPVSISYDRGRIHQLSQGSRSSTYSHGTDGLVSVFENPLGQTGTFERDLEGRILNHWLANGQKVEYTYNASGLPTSLTPPSGTGYSFTYTSLGLPDITTLPDGQATNLDYNADRMITVRGLPGSSLALGYDGAGRLVTQDLGGGAVITTAYGTNGRFSTISTPDEVLTFTWTGGPLNSESWSGLVKGTISYTFDSFHRKTSHTVSGADPITYSYDSDGLRTGAGDLGLTRDDQTGLVTQTWIGEVQDSTGYNSYGEPVSYSAAYPGKTLYSSTIMRDDLGRITGVEETLDGGTTTFTFDYDLTGRLTGYSINGNPADAYTYDGRWNRTGAGGITAVYDSGDRLTSLEGVPYTYDGDGRLATRGTGPQATAYSYDPLGRLLSVDPPGTDNTITYDYDGAGRRIRRSVNGTVTHRWIYQGGIRPAAEVDEDGNAVTLFVYGSRLMTPDYMVRDGYQYRIVTDERGSVRLVVRVGDGIVVQRMDYDPWGAVTGDTNPGFQPFGYAGGLYDPSTGLVRFGMRDYDAECGRFTAPDPLYLAGGQFNLYAYVGNDPINGIDPTGLVNWGLVYRGTGRLLGGTGGAIAGITLTGGTLGVAAIPGLALFGGGIYTAGAGSVDIFNGLFDVDPNLPNPGSVPAVIGNLAGGEKGEKIGDLVDMFIGLVGGRQARLAEEGKKYFVKAPGWLENSGNALTFVDSCKTIGESGATVTDPLFYYPTSVKDYYGFGGNNPTALHSWGAVTDASGHVNYQ